MPKRKAIGKKLRFDVFKRDGFVCVYCGATPSTEVMVIDHVIPVAEGGDNDINNLVTSCWPCNSGKGARSLDAIPESLLQKTEILAQRAEQLTEYAKHVEKIRRLEDLQVEAVVTIYERHNDGWTLSPSARQSVKHFISKIGMMDVMEAMDMACAQKPGDANLFRYFCGICWNWIRSR